MKYILLYITTKPWQNAKGNYISNKNNEFRSSFFSIWELTIYINKKRLKIPTKNN